MNYMNFFPGILKIVRSSTSPGCLGCLTMIVRASAWSCRHQKLGKRRSPWRETKLQRGRTWLVSVNSLPPGIYGNDFKRIFFRLVIQNNSLGSHREITLRWMTQNLANEKSTLVQVMAWCHQATFHYLSQCWPRSMLPCGITRPQWVNEERK